MKNLTTDQNAQIQRLVNLGDSLELATKTVLAQRVRSEEELDFYRTAYAS